MPKRSLFSIEHLERVLAEAADKGLLMGIPKVLTGEQRRQTEELLKRLKSVSDIFTDYQQHGGNPDRLLAFLWWFLDHPDKPIVRQSDTDLRTLRSSLSQCQKAIRKVLELPSHIRSYLSSHLIQTLEQASASLEEVSKREKQHGKRGRPKDFSNLNFVLAILDQEFRRCFKKPRVKDILRLVDAVGSEAESLTEEDIRQRIRSVLEGEEKATQVYVFHEELFGPFGP